MIKNFRNLLALLVMVFVFPGLWVCHGLKVIDLPEGIIGATISMETLIVQFYFRKKDPAETPTPTP